MPVKNTEYLHVFYYRLQILYTLYYYRYYISRNKNDYLNPDWLRNPPK